MSHPLLAAEAGVRHLLLGNEAIVRGALEAGIDPYTEGSPFPPPIIPLILHKISGIPEKLLGIGNGEALPLGGALGVIPRHGAGFHDHNVRAPLKRLLAGGMNTDVRYVHTSADTGDRHNLGKSKIDRAIQRAYP